MNNTILSKITLDGISPKSVPELLSAARSEFSHSNKFDGRFMRDVSVLFDAIACGVYESKFVWSDYNKGQWGKFVDLRVGFEGGSCMFSLEPDGELEGKPTGAKFKGLGVGVPTGMFPYSLFPVSGDAQAKLRESVTKLGKYTSDLVG